MAKRTRHKLKIPPKKLAQRIAVVKTGIAYQGTEIALLIPETAPIPEIVKSFHWDTAEMQRRAKRGSEPTIGDLYQECMRRQVEIENGNGLSRDN